MESLFSVKRWELSGEGHVAAGWLIPRWLAQGHTAVR